MPRPPPPTASSSVNCSPSTSSRSVVVLGRHSSVMRNGDDLASSDELKIYKDEGDADDDNKSSAENLDEEKRGLLTETEQTKLLEAKAAFYSRIGSRLLGTSDGDACTAAALRMSEYYGGLHRPVPFSTHLFGSHYRPYPHHQYHPTADSTTSTPGPTSPMSAVAAAAAAGFGGVTSLLPPPSPTQCFYRSSPYDHFPQSPAAAPHASSLHHMTSRTPGFSSPHQVPSPYRFPSTFLSPPSQFSHPFLPPELTQTSCFDPLSSNNHCGYGSLTFGVPCLSPAAAALGGFPPIPRLGSDYFASSHPGISSTYPGISHPALVSSYTSPGKEVRRPDNGFQLPLCCSPSDDGGSSRSLHSWYPRHVPTVNPSSLSSRLARHVPTASSQGGESTSTSLSSPGPTSHQAVTATDDFLVDRRQQTPAGAPPPLGAGLARYRHPNHGGFGSAFRSQSTALTSLPQLNTAKRSKLHRDQVSEHHVKKPLNAFMLFMKEMRSKVIDECTLKESAAINQILGRKWHSLDRVEQARYYEMARREKLMHRQLFPGWSARDNYAAIARKAKRKLLHQHIRPTVHQGLPVSTPLDRDNLNAKKCRARYGLEHQNRWCKPCRRKKRCIRFLDNSCSDEVASGGDAPTVVADSTSDAQISTSDAHHSFPPQRHRTRGPSSSGDVTLSKTQWPSPSSCSTLVSPVTGPGYRCLSPSLVAR